MRQVDRHRAGGEDDEAGADSDLRLAPAGPRPARPPLPEKRCREHRLDEPDDDADDDHDRQHFVALVARGRAGQPFAQLVALEGKGEEQRRAGPATIARPARHAVGADREQHRDGDQRRGDPAARERVDERQRHRRQRRRRQPAQDDRPRRAGDLRSSGIPTAIRAAEPVPVVERVGEPFAAVLEEAGGLVGGGEPGRVQAREQAEDRDQGDRGADRGDRRCGSRGAFTQSTSRKRPR